MPKVGKQADTNFKTNLALVVSYHLVNFHEGIPKKQSNLYIAGLAKLKHFLPLQLLNLNDLFFLFKS